MNSPASAMRRRSAARRGRAVAVGAGILLTVPATVVAGCGTGPRAAHTPAPSGASTTSSSRARTAPQRTTTSSTSSSSSTSAGTSCTLSPRQPEPVILLPGTFGATTTTWSFMVPRLAQLGYCLYTFPYGHNETGDIVTSAHELAGEVNRLLARTGAKRVSIVGHSQGGLMARYYIKFLGGAAKVDKLVALAPPNHGTENLAALGGGMAGCVACSQQFAGSQFLAKVNSGQEAPPPVDYTVIETVDDEVVVPYTSAFLTGPSSRVTNITLQQQCPTDIVGHIGIMTNPVALQWVENALAASGPADPSFIPSCSVSTSAASG